MKNFKYLVTLFLMVVILVPQVTFASWWNPFSWFKKKVVEVAPIIQLNTTTTNKNNDNIETSKEIENLKKEIEDLKIKQKKDLQPKIIKKVETQPEKINTISTPVTAPIVINDNLKKKEKENFDIYSQNAGKAIKELGAGGNYFMDALKITSYKSTLSQAYTQNSIDSCNSAYQINMNNTPPNLPFYTSMSDLNKIISDSAVNCKQRAQALQESIKNAINGNLPQAMDLNSQTLELNKKNLEINLQLKPKGDEVVSKAQTYFE